MVKSRKLMRLKSGKGLNRNKSLRRNIKNKRRRLYSYRKKMRGRSKQNGGCTTPPR